MTVRGDTMVSFTEAIRLFFQRYTDFRGRSTRAEYWWVQLAFILFFGLIAILLAATGGLDAFTDLDAIEAGTVTPEFSGAALAIIALAGLAVLALIVPAIALTVRRFHDAGLSGWIYLGLVVAGFIPYVGVLASLASLVITILPSKPDNKWGPNPHGHHLAGDPVI